MQDLFSYLMISKMHPEKQEKSLLSILTITLFLVILPQTNTGESSFTILTITQFLPTMPQTMIMESSLIGVAIALFLATTFIQTTTMESASPTILAITASQITPSTQTVVMQYTSAIQALTPFLEIT